MKQLNCYYLIWFNTDLMQYGLTPFLSKDISVRSNYHYNSWMKSWLRSISTRIYLLKVNDANTRTMNEIWSKLIINTLERRHWCRSIIFIVNFEQISRTTLVFPLFTLGMWIPAGIKSFLILFSMGKILTFC